MPKRLTSPQLQELLALRREGETYNSIARILNEKYRLGLSDENVRCQWRLYKSLPPAESPELDVAVIKSSHNAKVTASKTARVNRLLLDHLSSTDDILEQLDNLVAKLNKKIAIPKPPKSTGRKRMALELLLSDLHIGKLSDTYNLATARARLQQLTARVLRELNQAKKEFDVDRLVIAMLGDLIESATMHGIESARGVEFDNSRQVYEAINALLEDVLIPLARTGLRIDIPCVPGNHDRYEHTRTYADPGETNLSFIVYKTLERFSSALGLKNVRFLVTKNLFLEYDLFGNTFLYDHGDEVNSPTKAALELRMNKFQDQLGKFIHFYRVGHWHEFHMYGRGKIIVNESICGPDSYAVQHGFDTRCGQTLNFYVETSDRPTCFYRSFPIYLE